jgi:capsule polysaccharide export protein KpsE/RkpR
MPKRTSAPRNDVIAAHKKNVAKAERRLREAKAELARAQKGAKGGK